MSNRLSLILQTNKTILRLIETIFIFIIFNLKIIFCSSSNIYLTSILNLFLYCTRFTDRFQIYPEVVDEILLLKTINFDCQQRNGKREFT